MVELINNEKRQRKHPEPFIGVGMGTFCVKPIEELEISPFDQVGIAIAQLSNEAFTARLKNVEKLITLIANSPNDRFYKCHSALLKVSCTLICIICQARGIDLPSFDLAKLGNKKRSWAVSTNALISRQRNALLRSENLELRSIIAQAKNDYTVLEVR